MSDKNSVTEVTIEGGEAAAHVAYNLSEVVAIYPITPSSPMGEYSDAWSALNQENIWGGIPDVTEMQSEGGAAGAVHGALQAGALTTTFTASQGLLLMIPNMYKIAGELTPTVFHVSARSLAAQALSIFGDHSDVMSCRQTGFGMLCSGSVQEVMDLALIAHRTALETRIPFLHYFDGFRTSHEIMKIKKLTQDTIKEFVRDELISNFRDLAMTPDKPVLRGTAQNPDVYFQGRETVNKFYDVVPDKMQEAMDEFKKLTGRSYKLFDYVGDANAEKVIVLMGSGAEAADEAVDYLTKKGEKIGIVKVRLYRPFSPKHMFEALPASVKKIAVLDRTKEPGAVGEPLYQDIVTAFNEVRDESGFKFKTCPRIVGGRYGLSSKEFTPAMVKGIFDELSKDKPKNHFTIGIVDDVTHTSLDYDHSFVIEDEEAFRGIFFGLGADGTVSANKNSIKIIGEQTENYAQGYFVYDSKKSGSGTQSYLRFGKNPIKSTYLIQKANFIACSVYSFVETMNILEKAADNAVFLLNTPYGKDEIWKKLPGKVQQKMVDKNIKFYTIDAVKVAGEVGLGGRTNTIMQTCFFAISNIIPKDEAIAKIKEFVKKSFGKKGDQIVEQNFKAIDQSLANLNEVSYPKEVTNKIEEHKIVADNAPDFVKNFTAKVMAGRGEEIKVSEMPIDGTFPTATTKWEKRNIANEVPVWDPKTCIQCGKCSLVCPHAAIRMKAYDEKHLNGAPKTFKSIKAKGKEWAENTMYTIQTAVEDCTGCEVCVQVCPAKNKENKELKAINMAPHAPLQAEESKNWYFFDDIEDVDRSTLKTNTVKGSQFLRPLFEFSGACSGCGETPYVKLTSQLFGDRMLIANATGCSSIYGGNLPSTPWATNKEGRGPTWSNSLFEDNAEFGLGFRLTVDKKMDQAQGLVKKLSGQIGDKLCDELLTAVQKTEPEIFAQRARVDELKKKIASVNSVESKRLLELCDYLVKKSVWIMGGDGWAFDIGYGGLDHSLAIGRNINVLVLDTGVYSNTGGQKSKATPMGAVAKFAAKGQASTKKDLAMISMSYKNIYVAQIAMGANDAQTIKALIEAEAYDGPSLVIANTPCIAHGINMKNMLTQQKMAVESGLWPLFRYNPELVKEGKNPLQLDSKEPKISLEEYVYTENRFKMLLKSDPERAKQLLTTAQAEIKEKWEFYKYLASK